MTLIEGVVPALAKALANRDYHTLTPVQLAVLKPDISHADLLVSAQTGSGKTVAFGLAIGPTLLKDDEPLPKAANPLALIIAPTRELALQVKRELAWLYADTGAVVASCVGGMDIRTERRALARGAHIVVGTPGRLRDHISRQALDTSALKVVVLDEADEMLDLGFREDLEFILNEAPEQRRTLLFSATVPASIAKLAKSYQRDAIRITTQEEKQQHGDIEYRALVVAPRERDTAIVNVLRFYEAQNTLVFCNTRAAVNHMVARFKNRGFSVVALSGELTQGERTNALQSMRDGRARVCIATDVAARGIDLPNLELVIHADLPTDPDTLLHRSGRTGRAGRKGVSALIVEQRARPRAARLLAQAKINATWDNPPSADAVIQRDEERLFADPELWNTVVPEEEPLAHRVVAQFSPVQVAAALLRLSAAGKSAPEDIQMVPLTAPARDDKGTGKNSPGQGFREFDQSVWVTLSIGRRQNAEPRRLIPLICRVADLSKPDIGYIRVEQNQTHVELDANQADRFLAAIGPKLSLEKNIRVKVLESKPEFDKRGTGGQRKKAGPAADTKRRTSKHKSKKRLRSPTNSG